MCLPITKIPSQLKDWEPGIKRIQTRVSGDDVINGPCAEFGSLAPRLHAMVWPLMPVLGRQRQEDPLRAYKPASLAQSMTLYPCKMICPLGMAHKVDL